MKCCFKDWLVLLCSCLLLNSHCNTEGMAGCRAVRSSPESSEEEKKKSTFVTLVPFFFWKEPSGVYIMRTFQSFRIETVIYIESVNHNMDEQCYCKWTPPLCGVVCFNGSAGERVKCCSVYFNHAVLRVGFQITSLLLRFLRCANGHAAMNTSY